MVVYGTRPEAVKLAPVIAQLRDSDVLTGTTVVTGQHREMLAQVNELFGIAPDHDLALMRNRQTLSGLFARVLEGLDPIMEREHPSAVLVQGDTSTSTAAALAAFHRQIPVVHLEAGLRSGSIASPFPEEGNRQITTRLAALHLAPTSESRDNLLAEGVDPATITVTGNTVIDALLTVASKTRPLEPTAAPARRRILVTTHRRENLGDRHRGVAQAVAEIAGQFPDVDILVPLHPNPAVRETVVPELAGHPNITVVEPLDYPSFVAAMVRCDLVLTDSGGVQEEAPSLGKPVLVLRDNTERPEGVTAGTARLVGTDPQRIVAEITRLLTDPTAYAAMAHAVNPYGDGHAADRTVAAIAQLLGVGRRLADFAGGEEPSPAP